MGVIVFGQDIEEAAIDVGFDVVELGDVGVLEPVDQHLRAKDEEKWSQHLPKPLREDGETVRNDAGASDWKC